MYLEERLERLEAFLAALAKRVDVIQDIAEKLSEIDRIRHEPEEGRPCEI